MNCSSREPDFPGTREFLRFETTPAEDPTPVTDLLPITVQSRHRLWATQRTAEGSDVHPGL
jgi:hypothetical protein